MTTKPYFEKPEGDGSNDEEVAAEEWRKHGLREDSEVRGEDHDICKTLAITHSPNTPVTTPPNPSSI